MAVTVTGCYNKETGQVLFDEGGCVFAGCLVDEGIHKGQIEVTIGGSCCTDDTYYACFDELTGRFSVSIPERCCDENDNCKGSPGCNDDWVYPREIFATISGVVDSGCQARDNSPFQPPVVSSFQEGNAAILNGTHKMTNCFSDDHINNPNPCIWRAKIGFARCIQTNFNNSDCTPPGGEVDSGSGDMYITLAVSGGKWSFLMQIARADIGPMNFVCANQFFHNEASPSVIGVDYFFTARSNQASACVFGPPASYSHFCGTGSVQITIPPPTEDLYDRGRVCT